MGTPSVALTCFGCTSSFSRYSKVFSSRSPDASDWYSYILCGRWRSSMIFLNSQQRTVSMLSRRGGSMVFVRNSIRLKAVLSSTDGIAARFSIQKGW